MPFGSVTVLAGPLFNKIKNKKKNKKEEKEEEEEDEELEKTFICISHMFCQNTFILGKNLLFFVC